MAKKFFIQPARQRPDYRLVIAFLWSDDHEVDTEGDSYNLASRDWTCLYCQNREKPEEVFEIGPVSQSPLCMEIESKTPELAARVAYFLAKETDSMVASDPQGTWRNLAWLIARMGNFDLEAADRRSRHSCWRKSTPANPYPNLDTRAEK